MARATMAAVAAAASISTRSGSSFSAALGRPRQHPPWAHKSSLFPKFAFNILPRDFSVSLASVSERSRTHVEYSRVVASDEAPEKPKDHAEECSSTDARNPQNSSEVPSKLGRSEEPLKLSCAAAMLPHPAKAAKGGEDAFFVEGSWLGVSDGVGGWANEGVDAGVYSRELMSHCKALVTSVEVAYGGDKGEPNPKGVLVNAARLTKATGSATALVAVLHDQMLYIANLGDSGAVVIRDSDVVFETKSMQHQFNFPFQIGTMGDDPQLAETYGKPVCRGDVIVVGTDGLFDNLFVTDIMQIVKDTLGKGSSVQEAATRLALKAQIAGKSSNPSPFSKAAGSKLYGFEGGKLDDVTTVVALVV